MKLQEILTVKGSTVFSIGPEATLNDVVAELMRRKCGSLVVCDGETMVGIITERDILRACEQNGGRLGERRVSEFMSREVATGTPCDDINQAMALMTQRRIRHLPILNEGRLAGMISIGDLVKAHADALAVENHQLRSYIQTGAGDS